MLLMQGQTYKSQCAQEALQSTPSIQEDHPLRQRSQFYQLEGVKALQ